MILNLPPEIRMKEKFIHLAAVWFGPKKPSDMSLIIKPVIKKMKQLAVTGIHAQTPSGVKHVKAVLLAGVFDLL